MSQTTNGARHRAARRPMTPLNAIGHAAIGPNGRRAAVAAASSGLVLTLTASASLATVDSPQSKTGDLPTANLTALPGDDNGSTEPTVSVADDAEWEFTATDASAEAAPEPEPEPRAEPVSRSNDRQAPAEETESEDPEPDEAEEAPAPSSSGNEIVDIARRYIGTPYVHGGTSPDGFDCSGFTQYVFAQAGVSLPRATGAQSSAGTQVSASEAQPGDLVWEPGHIGIYTGDGNHIAARNPGTPLTEGPIYMSNPTFIRVSG